MFPSDIKVNHVRGSDNLKNTRMQGSQYNSTIFFRFVKLWPWFGQIMIPLKDDLWRRFGINESEIPSPSVQARTCPSSVACLNPKYLRFRPPLMSLRRRSLRPRFRPRRRPVVHICHPFLERPIFFRMVRRPPAAPTRRNERANLPAHCQLISSIVLPPPWLVAPPLFSGNTMIDFDISC